MPGRSTEAPSSSFKVLVSIGIQWDAIVATIKQIAIPRTVTVCSLHRSKRSTSAKKMKFVPDPVIATAVVLVNLRSGGLNTGKLCYLLGGAVAPFGVFNWFF